jgi:DNA-directed RNA polymerase specialized sigma24 family protein
MEGAGRQLGSPWALTREGLAKLLFKLSSDPLEAGARYEALRSRLIIFFTRRRLDFPEDLADQVLDRVVKRLEENTPIASGEAFALGVARHVAQEQAKKPIQYQELNERVFHNIVDDSSTSIEESGTEEERILQLERCLKRLTHQEVALLKRYYLAASGNRIEIRRSLAGELLQSPAEIRQRVFLLRRKLRQCIERQANIRSRATNGLTQHG